MGDRASGFDEQMIVDLINLFKKDGRSDQLRLIALGRELIAEVLGLLSRITIGVPDNGQIIFAYSDTDVLSEGGHYESSLHWSRRRSAWELRLRHQDNTGSLYFELPTVIYQQWAASEFAKEATRHLKLEYMKQIVLFRKSGGQLKVVLCDATSLLEQHSRQLGLDPQDRNSSTRILLARLLKPRR